MGSGQFTYTIFYILTVYLAKESRFSAGGSVVVVRSSPLRFSFLSATLSDKTTSSESTHCVGVTQKQRR